MKISMKDTFYTGLMLFALFFGAGNLIFPPSLGFEAGENFGWAMIGFLITSVGLPILGVAAIAKSGDLSTITNRVHPIFAVGFTVITYLCLGPFLVIPRAGTTAYEMGIAPFITEGLTNHWLPLFLWTIIYFAIAFWLCMNPTKLFERIGKILTPIIIVLIALIFIQSLNQPIGDYGTPSETYMNNALFKGITDGYSTMDAMAALLFGSVIINAIRKKGITDSGIQTKLTIKAGMIAGFCLAIIYVMLSHLGASSQSLLQSAGNGGEILTAVTNHLFGNVGTLILGIIFILACLTTTVGLIASCGEYFSKVVPKLSYFSWTAILCLISMILANLGLNQIILFSSPILTAIYPLTIVIILLSFSHKYFKGYRSVYIGAIVGTAFISLVGSLKEIGFHLNFIMDLYSYIPLYNIGLGWIFPAIIGSFIGYLWGEKKLDGSYSVSQGNNH